MKRAVMEKFDCNCNYSAVYLYFVLILRVNFDWCLFKMVLIIVLFLGYYNMNLLYDNKFYNFVPPLLTPANPSPIAT